MQSGASTCCRGWRINPEQACWRIPLSAKPETRFSPDTAFPSIPSFDSGASQGAALRSKKDAAIPRRVGAVRLTEGPRALAHAAGHEAPNFSTQR